MFKQIVSVKRVKYTNSFESEVKAVIVKVELDNEETKEFIVSEYGMYVNEWPLGTKVPGIEAEALKELLRTYDIHKTACELGSV